MKDETRRFHVKTFMVSRNRIRLQEIQKKTPWFVWSPYRKGRGKLVTYRRRHNIPSEETE